MAPGVIQASPYGNTVDDSGPVTTFSGKGEKQPNSCKDLPFALLFYAHLIAMVVVAFIYGSSAFDQTKDTGGIDYTGYIIGAAVCGIFAIILSGVMFLILMQFAEIMIKISLFFVVIMSLVWCVLAFLTGNIVAAIFGLLFFFIGLCYARAVWSRIPFATVNLVTGMTAIKANCGITIVGYFMVFMGLLWSLLWTLALIGIVNETTIKNCPEGWTDINQCGGISQGYMFLLFVSYFWTQQIIQNIIHVTVAGTVGTWWFSPDEANSCCSSAVLSSWFRSVTTSFGSICFGSLIVAVIQALRQLAYMARQDGGDNGILLCIAECILSCLQSLIEYFNKWAYIYVGVYGYSYIEAGKNVMSLFTDRGWEAIIADDLVGNTLFLVSLITGMLTGCIGLILNSTTDLYISAPEGTGGPVSMIIGFIIGLMLTSIVMSLVGSSVNTVIVCFADGPSEFEANHPELSRKMRDTWRGSFPDF